MNVKKVVLAATLALSAAGAAQADQTWAFSYAGDGVNASGTFTTAGAALVAEDILSISGLRNGMAITGLVPLDTDLNFTYDNQFKIGTPNFSDGGMLFSVAGGQPNTNVYYFDDPDFGLSYFEVYVDPNDVAINVPISWSVTAVPEPATVLSMLAGLGLMGVYMRKRRVA